jgi:hypothetical protein
MNAGDFNEAKDHRGVDLTSDRLRFDRLLLPN